MPNVERMERLEKLLVEDARNDTGLKFNMTLWGAPADTSMVHYPNWDKKPEKPPVVSCDTQGCGMGLAAISGEFAADGLRADYEPRHGGFQLIPVFTDKDGVEHEGYEAAQQLFDITQRQASFLFNPDEYCKTRGADVELEVAARVRQVIEGHDGYLTDALYEDEDDEDDFGPEDEHGDNEDDGDTEG